MTAMTGNRGHYLSGSLLRSATEIASAIVPVVSVSPGTPRTENSSPYFLLNRPARAQKIASTKWLGALCARATEITALKNGVSSPLEGVYRNSGAYSAPYFLCARNRNRRAFSGPCFLYHRWRSAQEIVDHIAPLFSVEPGRECRENSAHYSGRSFLWTGRRGLQKIARTIVGLISVRGRPARTENSGTIASAIFCKPGGGCTGISSAITSTKSGLYGIVRGTI